MASKASTNERPLHLKIVLVGCALSFAFILLLLIIVNSSPTPDTANTAVLDLSGIISLLKTRRSYFVYETLLAGMLGAYISEIFHIGSMKTDAELSGHSLQFGVSLFVGGAAAIIVGVLFPLVVLGRFEGAEINSWTLVAASGLAGNRSRAALSQVETVLGRLLASFEPHLDAAISDTVRVGVQEALAVRPPVRYDGFVAADIMRSNESVWRSDSAVAQLEPGAQFELIVQFAPDKQRLGSAARGVVKTITISEGESQSSVPFRLLVDFGFVELAPEERTIVVPRSAPSEVQTFTFMAPSDSRYSEGRQPREISVSVYQYTRYFESCLLPIATLRAP